MKMRTLSLGGLVVAGAIIVPGCGGAASTAPSAQPSTASSEAPGPSAAPAPGGAGVAVTIADFTLPEVNAAVGQEITWTNGDPAAHTVTTDDGAVDGRVAGSGGTFSHAFDAAGSYPYHCAIHPSMTGAITITG
jgi:plastocyanin